MHTVCHFTQVHYDNVFEHSVEVMLLQVGFIICNNSGLLNDGLSRQVALMRSSKHDKFEFDIKLFFILNHFYLMSLLCA